MSQLILNEQLSDQAPSEILVIKFGKTNTRKGAYLFDETSAKQVMDLYTERGLDLYFDYNHLSMEPENDEQGKAAGWYRLEVREDGLWAVDIKWTDKAKGQIEAKEYRYISPVIITDKDTKVIRLINIALTNLPATDDLIPLVKLTDPSGLDLLATKIADDLILKGATDKNLSLVISKIKDLASKKLKEEVKLKEGETMQNKMKHLEHLDESMDYLTAYSMHLGEAMLIVDEDMDGDSEEDVDQDEISVSGMRSMYKDHMDTLMKMADCVKGKRLALDPLQTYVKKEDMFYSLGQLTEKVVEKIIEKEEIIKVEQEVPAMLTEQVISMTGKTELNEQLGVLMALKDNVSRLSEENMSLAKEVKALNEKIVTTKKDKVIEDAMKSKKLLPAQKAWALSVPMDLLESYLAVTPVMLTDSKVREAILDKEEPVSDGVAKFKSMFTANLKQTIGKE